VRTAWDQLTSAALAALILQAPQPLAVLGWGRPAALHLERTTAILSPSRCAGPRLYATASHPSPLSARRATGASPAFLGCGHFAHANAWLMQHRQDPIRW
jgi:uracil-DNA glycosylase